MTYVPGVDESALTGLGAQYAGNSDFVEVTEYSYTGLWTADPNDYVLLLINDGVQQDTWPTVYAQFTGTGFEPVTLPAGTFVSLSCGGAGFGVPAVFVGSNYDSPFAGTWPLGTSEFFQPINITSNHVITRFDYDGTLANTNNLQQALDAIDNLTVTGDHGGLSGLADDDHTQYALADGTRGEFQRATPDEFVFTNSDFAADGITPGFVLYLGTGGDTLTLPPVTGYEGQSYLIVAGNGDVTVATPTGEFINGFLTSYEIKNGNVVAFVAFSGGLWITAQRAGSMFDLPDWSSAAVADVLTIGAGGNPEWAAAATGSSTSSITHEPSGYPNRVDSVISFDNTSRTFTIAPTAASFDVYQDGTAFNFATAQTVTVPNTTGLYYIYFASGAYSYQTSFFDLENQVPTAYVYWHSDTGKAEYFADERHGMVLDWQTHEYLHRTRGASLASGFVLANYTVTGTGGADADAQAGLTDGTFYDEDIQIDVTNSLTPAPGTWEQHIAPVGEFPVAYRDSTGDWRLDAPTSFPIKPGPAGRAAYNLYSSGTWTTPDLGNNKYGISWLVATNNLDYPVFVVLGQTEYTSQVHASSAVWENLSLGGFPSLEFRPLYKLIYATASSYSNAVKSKLVAVEDIRSMARVGAGVSVSDHGGLTGLADDDHTQYALADGSRGNFDAAGAASAVQSNLTTHEGLTTTAHGGIVSSTDPRLTDTRTPTSHASSHQDGGIDELALDASQTTTGTFTTNRLGSGTASSTAQSHLRAGSSGAEWVASVARAATTANITLSGTQTVDGVALSVGDIVLVKNQSTSAQNGVYSVAAGAWTALTADTTVTVTSGTTNAGTVWSSSVSSAPTPGTLSGPAGPTGATGTGIVVLNATESIPAGLADGTKILRRFT